MATAAVTTRRPRKFAAIIVCADRSTYLGHVDRRWRFGQVVSAVIRFSSAPTGRCERLLFGSPLRLRADGHHRNGRQADDLLGHAPKEHVRETSAAMRAHDDQIRSALLRGPEDLLP